MPEYRRVIATDYKPEGIKIMMIAGIPAILPDKIDSFKQAVEKGYIEMMRTFGVDISNHPIGLGIQTRVQSRNELIPVMYSKRGSIICRKKLLPYVMEIRAKIPFVSYLLEGSKLREFPDDSMRNLYFHELERIVDAALEQSKN